VTDLDAFRQALKAYEPPGPTGLGLGAPGSSALDIGEIMAKGRWLRRRRRLAAAGGSVCLAAAAFAAVTSISHLSRPSHVPALSPATSTGSKSGLAPGRAAALAVREGRVISTGIEGAAGEVVFYGIRIHLRELPGTTFGIMAAQRDSSGGLTPEVEMNETTGSDTAPGFHAVESSASVGSPAVAIPEFGYYAGPAAKITAVEGGQQVQAGTARWSVNPGIVIFWFPPSTDPGGAPLQDLTANDAAGHQLPAG
jgi:hypothetical protein